MTINDMQATVTEIGDYRTMVTDLVYNSLKAAGEVCRLRCHTDPDLLDAIGDGILKFIADGDVFEQVIRRIVEVDPQLIERASE